MDPKLRAFLSLIGWSESTSTSPITKNDGYDIIVSGVEGPNRFDDYSTHPFAAGRPPIVVNHNGLKSTASGRYQLLLHWWAPYKTILHLQDFSPASQDAIAIQQIKEQRAYAPILAGDIQGAIERCSNIWASFPGNDYGQHPHPVALLLEKYAEFVIVDR